ncbi:MAG: hypothetical protein EXQ86_04295 [Rhodospirillales bacterium]|nr:hypothetical protein [Rhodospirillales bacterium]
MDRAYSILDTAANAYSNALVWWVERVRRYAWFVTVASIALAVGAAVFFVTHVRVTADTSDMISPDLPFRKVSSALGDAFPQFSDNVLLVIDGQVPDLADDAASALAARLRQRPELFGYVYDLAGDPFFRRNGLLYLDEERLNELSDRLAEAQPFVGALWRDPSLRGFFEMLVLAIDEILKAPETKPGATVFEIGTALNKTAAVAEAQAAGRYAPLSWHELMAGDDTLGTTARRFLLVQPSLDFSSLEPATRAMSALRGLIREMNLTPERGVRVRITGSAALSHEELESVSRDMDIAGVLAFLLVIGILVAGYRSARLVLATLVTMLVGLAWTAAFAVLAVQQLNLMSVAFGVLFIGLGVDLGIQFGLRYQEAVAKGSDHAAALREAARGLAGALTLCTATSAIGFFSFLPTAYVGLAQLGLISGTGMFIALFATYTVLPGLLTLMPVSGQGGAGSFRIAAKPLTFIRRHARVIVWIALLLGAVGTMFALRVRFDFDPLNLRDRRAESVSTLFDLMKDSRTTPYAITVLADNLQAAEELARKLKSLKEVEGASSILDYVPERQPEKLEIIRTMVLFLSTALAAPVRPPPTNEERQEALRKLDGALSRFAAQADGEAATAAARLKAALTALLSNAASHEKLAELEKRLVTTLPGRLQALADSLNAQPVTLESLPKDLRDRQIARDGRTRIEVYPRENVHDRAALYRFVDAVRSVVPDATGAPIIILESGNAVVGAFMQALAVAIGLILILLFVALRRLRDVALAMAPLVLATILTLAVASLLGLSFNFANVIVLPLFFGLGVAFGIYIIMREREERAREESGDGASLATSTPRAVALSALTTAVSFGSIAIASHPGTSSMGVLSAVSLLLSLGCALIVLPALMTIWPVEPERKPANT